MKALVRTISNWWTANGVASVASLPGFQDVKSAYNEGLISHEQFLRFIAGKMQDAELADILREAAAIIQNDAQIMARAMADIAEQAEARKEQATHEG